MYNASDEVMVLIDALNDASGPDLSCIDIDGTLILIFKKWDSLFGNNGSVDYCAKGITNVARHLSSPQLVIDKVGSFFEAGAFEKSTLFEKRASEDRASKISTVQSFLTSTERVTRELFYFTLRAAVYVNEKETVEKLLRSRVLIEMKVYVLGVIGETPLDALEKYRLTDKVKKDLMKITWGA